ncbi:MAG: RdgB/HAM1 family non-canonical purine NTP pyrophosphatase [Bacteroidetes bacterium]|nr:RdgB/HAM1 family non-canonical purine NTP pyrophosphatase [Bacteroidota bacterium]
MENNQLIFASNNQHKVEEINSIIGNVCKVISLKEAGIDIDIPEPYDTIEANASEKSKTIFALTGKNCFGDDTGLEVDALNGEPGVKSARYAGEEKNFSANINKLLFKMKGFQNRSAQFKTIISLMWNGEEHIFEGITRGKIIDERRGTNGFGYDPVFIPDGSDKTFGEMELSEKNLYSHRRKAMDKLIEFLISEAKR